MYEKGIQRMDMRCLSFPYFHALLLLNISTNLLYFSSEVI